MAIMTVHSASILQDIAFLLEEAKHTGLIKSDRITNYKQAIDILIDLDLLEKRDNDAYYIKHDNLKHVFEWFKCFVSEEDDLIRRLKPKYYVL